MNKRHGFTLAEVLITLVIIGVIAAMTVPTLMQSTNNEEYRSAFKKAVAMLNQAITMNYALTGNDASVYNSNSSMVSMFSSRLSVLKTEANKFFTADGMEFTVSPTACNDTTGCGTIAVDVNGLKGPNQETTEANSPRDRYTVTLFRNRVVPNNVGSQIMYNQN